MTLPGEGEEQGGLLLRKNYAHQVFFLLIGIHSMQG